VKKFIDVCRERSSFSSDFGPARSVLTGGVGDRAGSMTVSGAGLIWR